MDCPVVFTVSAKRRNNEHCLSVSSHKVSHNHPVDEQMFNMYPSVRRLDADQRKTQEELVCTTE